MREIGPEKENGPRNGDREIGGKYSENSVLPRAMLLARLFLESSGTQSNCLITYLPPSKHCLEGAGQQRVCCQVFLKSTPLDGGTCTQVFCFLLLTPPHITLVSNRVLHVKQGEHTEVAGVQKSSASLPPTQPSLWKLQKEPWCHGGHRLQSQTQLPVPKPAVSLPPPRGLAL